MGIQTVEDIEAETKEGILPTGLFPGSPLASYVFKTQGYLPINSNPGQRAVYFCIN